MNMMISYQELVRTFPSGPSRSIRSISLRDGPPFEQSSSRGRAINSSIEPISWKPLKLLGVASAAAGRVIDSNIMILKDFNGFIF